MVGLLIVIEGINGCGKTTIINNILKFYKGKKEVVVYKFPNRTTKYGKILDKFLKKEIQIDSKYDILDLFTKNRQDFQDSIFEDIKSNKQICDEFGVELRYSLEYRVFNHEILAKICQILKSMNINTVSPSSGMMIDEISDNLIACEYLTKKSDIQCICTGNLWKSDQLKNAINSKVYGIRFMNNVSLNLYNIYI